MKRENARYFPGPSLHLPKPCVVVSVAFPGDAARAAELLVQAALALQKRAGYDVSLGRAKPLGDGRFEVAVETEWPAATIGALGAGAALVREALRDPRKARAAEDAVAARYLARLARSGLNINQRYMLHAAKRAGIAASPVDRLTLRLGLGCRARVMHRMMTDATSHLAVQLSSDKTRTLALLADAGLPVPAHVPVSDEAAALAAGQQLGWPLVVKPERTDRGLGITLAIGSREALLEAYRRARRFDAGVAVESFVPGETYRLLVVGGRFVAASRTAPAAVTGDGRSSVRELVAAANRAPDRGPDHTLPLSWIEPDDEAATLLRAAGLSWDSVPASGSEVRLRAASNLSRGGNSIDVTGQAHPGYRRMAELAARTVGLDLAGIDLRAPSIDAAPDGRAAILEVNPSPGLRMHHSPASGAGVDVGRKVLELLFPPGAAHRIPVAAITGTNGKTTTSRLLAHMLESAGHRTGRVTTGEMAIGERVLETGDCAGPAYARRILASREVEAAVLETARGGIVKYGIGFESCDAAAVLNVAEDHIGIDGIADLEQMAALKRLVADTATGTLVLNAEDARCLAMAQGRRAAKVILFSLDPQNAALSAHLGGGEAAYVVEGKGGEAHFVRCSGEKRERLLAAREAPMTLGGAARFNLANAAAALALAEALDVPREAALQGLRSFQADFAANPGRMNLYRELPFAVLLDYAHNAHGLAQVLPLIGQLPVRGRRICCFGVNGVSHGNERAMRHAALLAGHFDAFVPYTWDHPKKRRADLPGVLRQGLLDAGVAAAAIRPHDGEKMAIDAALDWAQAGDLLVVFWGTDERAAWARITARSGGG